MIHVFIVNVYIEYKKFFGAGAGAGGNKKKTTYYILYVAFLYWLHKIK